MPIIYALVARGNIVLSEYTGSDGNFPTVTRILLSRMPADKPRMSYVYDAYVFHYIVRNGLTYLAMADRDFGFAAPLGCLEAMADRFEGSYGSAGLTAITLAMNADFQHEIKWLLNAFNESPPDSCGRIKSQIDDIQSVMVDSIDKIVQRGERIDLLVNRAERLNEESVEFHRQARRIKRSMAWRNFRIGLVVASAIAFLCLLSAMWRCGGMTFPSCRKR
eukprot:GHVT01032993.1.p1 GENE.GHVT01032993.1~~GHVT01032993.1.p1  ORF type:complete len:220 (-),score=38.98 GHVT01032993.1:919-1578(-)